MEISIKDNFFKDIDMEKVNIGMQIRMFIKDFGKTIRKMIKIVLFSFQQDQFIKVKLKMANIMDMVNLQGQEITIIKETI
jgi:hypothetical protein